MKKNIVIGVAGHIDHGKTTIVKRITGIDTDSLIEEKRRGMTIESGFSYINADKMKIGVIDLPGHNRFIKNMIVGANGINYLLLVISADDGIMPQTEEHFEICSLLGIERGIIALTKTDISTKEMIEDRKKEIREYFKKSFLEKSQIVEISIKNEKSYEVLKDKILKEVDELEENTELIKRDFKMSIDRVFNIKGAGVVVTGTILKGEVKKGDKLYIYPKNKEVRVKKIENHSIEVERLEAENRCALNLAGIEVEEIRRGDIISSDKGLKLNKNIDVYIEVLSGERKIKNNSILKVDLGTVEVKGKVKIFGSDELKDGEKGFAQLRLEEEIVLEQEDRGILRGMDNLLLGGFKIVNIEAKKVKRDNEEYVEELKLKIFGTKLERVKLFLEKESKKIVKYEILEERFNIKWQEIKESDGIVIGEYCTTKAYIKLLQRKIEELFDSKKLKITVSKAEIKERIFEEWSLNEFNILMKEFSKEFLEMDGDKVALKNRVIKLTKEEKKIKDKVLIEMKNLGFNCLDKNTKSDNNEIRIINFLIEKKLIVCLDGKICVLDGFYKEAVKILKNYLEKNNRIKLNEFRDLIKTNRKIALLFLEKMDRDKITKKIDDYRVLIK